MTPGHGHRQPGRAGAGTQPLFKVRREPLLALVLLGSSLLLPTVLVFSAIRSYRAVADVRDVYLRTRAATVKEQLDLLPSLEEAALENVFAADPDVAEVRVYAQPLADSNPEASIVNAIFSGDSLYSAAEVGILHRSYVVLQPLSAGYKRRVARIDTRSAAGDRLVGDALRHLTIAYVAALGSLGTLAAYLVLVRRATRLAHLAQIGAMSAALAHEIRNPLGTIKGFAQLTARAGDEKTKRFQDLILTEVGRLEKLVEDLLSFSRPREPVIRETAWAEIVPRLSASDGEGKTLLSFEAPKSLMLTTDPDIVVEIALNLIRNAVDASDEGGKVSVRAQLLEGNGVICVDDQGLGVLPEVRRQAFEPFFTTKASGTGLGLPISKRLAERLNGKLDLIRLSPRGTRARLQLPGAYLAAADDDLSS